MVLSQIPKMKISSSRIQPIQISNLSSSRIWDPNLKIRGENQQDPASLALAPLRPMTSRPMAKARTSNPCLQAALRSLAAIVMTMMMMRRKTTLMTTAPWTRGNTPQARYWRR
jgi:hypothetical protein